MVFITTKTECKIASETIIQDQFKNLECAICVQEINNNEKGFVYITFGQIADLERLMCKRCDKLYEKHDPYKREILYRFEYPFINNEHAKAFVEKSKTFNINEGKEEKIQTFSQALKNSINGYQDVELDLKLTI
ncbi:unknown [Choristoneura occidentalis granulovirus]|uniref:Uncharacterized protein n=2 Tax=Betabaculovirus chofumiferanae TaxID=3051997 RepID=Q1A4I7_9BBAC|nr:unknown [Choristoneura fumiferana granulovirus]ABC61243.1 unknown [Choristoneura fumiferana granulovirus]